MILIRLDEAAEWAHRPIRDLRHWVARGYLNEECHDRAGRPLYDQRKVLDLEHAMRNRTRTRAHLLQKYRRVG